MSQRLGEGPRGEYLKQQQPPLQPLHLLASHNFQHSTTEWTTLYPPPSTSTFKGLLSFPNYLGPSSINKPHFDLTSPSPLILYFTLSSPHNILSSLHDHSYHSTFTSLACGVQALPLPLSFCHHLPRTSTYFTFVHVSTPTRFLPEQT